MILLYKVLVDHIDISFDISILNKNYVSFFLFDLLQRKKELGCSQVVRHWTLTSTCKGSNPFSPVFIYIKVFSPSNSLLFINNRHNN